MTKRPKPIVLTVLDGWGYRAETKGNAIALARKPAYDRLIKEFPNTLVQTSGPAVGLPEGQMGNSEVGHLNIGAGRVLLMDVMRIDLMIESGEFFRNPVDAATGRRNAGPLEFPTSPVFLGGKFCTTSSDGNRRDNFPNSGGEVTGTGKISCLDQRLDVPGVPLPVR